MNRAGGFAVSVLALLLALSASAATPQLPPSQAKVDQRIATAEISSSDVSLSGAPRLPRREAAGEPPFTRVQGNLIGIPHLTLLTPDLFSPPFFNGRGVAGGDVDKNGFQDIVIGTQHGIKLYQNAGQMIFTEQRIEIPAIEKLDVFTVALVDIDNDSWLDIVLTSYGSGNFVLHNDRGAFRPDGVAQVGTTPTVLSTSLTFGDVDEDGDLDAVLGNWYYGTEKRIPPVDATNELLRYEDGRFHGTPMDEILGETHSVLLSDFNLDNHLDLIVGNDFTPPDIYYLGDGEGRFRMVKRTDGLIPVSTDTTMSIDTADFNNDMRMDIFLAQIAAGATGPSAQVKRRVASAYCDDLNRDFDKQRCAKGVFYEQRFFNFGARHQASHIQRCKTIPDRITRNQCAAMMILKTAVSTQKRELCERMPSGQEEVAHRCRLFFVPSKHGTPEEYAQAIKVKLNENVLLVGREGGHFEDRAIALGADITGWSWNARFLDADNDEWQDLYVVNGFWPDETGPSQKFFLKNIEGQRFEELTDEFGLQNYTVQSSYVSADFDNDGDLDLLANSVHGPIWLYRNNEARNHSILFELRDHRGNRFCIGCKVRITYGTPERRQLREMKSGGGYHSFDPPILHFGLGTNDSVARLEVTWSTGETTHIEGPLPANVLYTIHRQAPAPAQASR